MRNFAECTSLGTVPGHEGIQPPSGQTPTIRTCIGIYPNGLPQGLTPLGRMPVWDGTVGRALPPPRSRLWRAAFGRVVHGAVGRGPPREVLFERKTKTARGEPRRFCFTSSSLPSTHHPDEAASCDCPWLPSWSAGVVPSTSL